MGGMLSVFYAVLLCSRREAVAFKSRLRTFITEHINFITKQVIINCCLRPKRATLSNYATTHAAGIRWQLGKCDAPVRGLRRNEINNRAFQVAMSNRPTRLAPVQSIMLVAPGGRKCACH